MFGAVFRALEWNNTAIFFWGAVPKTPKASCSRFELPHRRDELGRGILATAGGGQHVAVLVPGGQHAADGLVAGGADPVRLAVDVNAILMPPRIFRADNHR
jgi:hypothetical protein